MMKKKFDFVGKRKMFFAITLAIILVGLIFNVIFGTQLDIKFTGGAITSYSYEGTIDAESVQNVAEESTGAQISSVQVNQDVQIAGSDAKVSTISISFSGNNALSLDQHKAMTAALQENFPDNNIQQGESNSVDATMGRDFLLKCLVAVALASILMVIYVAFRFKKMGWSAGVMALVALLIDVTNVYFTFIIFRLPIDDNFIAVALTILGYSLNDTIIIYDRIREMRKGMSPKTDLGDVVNASINQNLGRTINTSLCTFAAVACVFVVSLVFNLDSVTAFALPMMVGIVSGCYTSTCLVGPLWVMWKRHHSKAKAAKKARA